MNGEKIGVLIRRLRCEQRLTQRQLAERLHVSDRAVSKWENGRGCPDIALLNRLCDVLNVDVAHLLEGEAAPNPPEGGNMKKNRYYVCPSCGNLVIETGEGAVSCCGRPLTPLVPTKAGEKQRLQVQRVEDEWFITTDHPMTKESHIPFVAFVTGEQMILTRCYPEWDLQLRLPVRRHGLLLWYTPEDGLLTQLL